MISVTVTQKKTHFFVLFSSSQLLKSHPYVFFSPLQVITETLVLSLDLDNIQNTPHVVA